MAIITEKIKELLGVIEEGSNAYLFKDGSVKPVYPTKDYSDIEATISTDDVKKKLAEELFGKEIPDRDDYKNLLSLVRIVHQLADVKNKTAIQKKLNVTFTDKVVLLRKPTKKKTVKGKISIKEKKEKDPTTGEVVTENEMSIEPEKEKSKKRIF